MSTLRDAVNIARVEPDSERSKQLMAAIHGGKFDVIAQKEGLDLSKFKSMGNKSINTPANPPAQQGLGASFGNAFRKGFGLEDSTPEIQQPTAPAAKYMVPNAGKADTLKSASEITPDDKRMMALSTLATMKENPANIGANATEIFKQGLEAAKPGTDKIVDALNPAYPSTPEDRFSKVVGGGFDVGNAAMQSVFAGPAAIVESIPGVNKAVAYGGEKLMEGSKFASDRFKEHLGIDPNSEQGKAIDSGFNMLTQLFAAYGGEKILGSKPVQNVLAKTNEFVKPTIDNIKAQGVNTLNAANEGLKAGIDNFQKSLKPSAEALDTKLNKVIDTGIEKGVKPSVVGKKTIAQAENFKVQQREGVKTIVQNKQNLSFNTPDGEVIQGQVPKNLDQFNQSIAQSKADIFKQYDAQTKMAGQAGVKVDVTPIASELQKVAENTVLQDTHPEVAKYASSKAEIYNKRGSYTPEEAQQAIKIYNDSLQAFYKNPTYDNFARANIDAMVANRLRASLDSSIETSVGGNYQQLKNKYGALSALEKEVNHRAIVDARKNNIGLGQNFADIMSAGEAMHGIMSMNPASMASSIAIKGVARYIKYINDPNHIVGKMFTKVDNILSKMPQPEVVKPQPKAPLLLEGPSGKPLSTTINMPKRTQSSIDAAEMTRLQGQKAVGNTPKLPEPKAKLKDQTLKIKPEDISALSPYELSTYISEVKKYNTPKEYIDNNYFKVSKTNGGRYKIEHNNGELTFSIDKAANEFIIEDLEAFKKRQGTGTRLIQEAEKIAEKKGLDVSFAAEPQDSSISKPDLYSFYENLGYDNNFGLMTKLNKDLNTGRRLSKGQLLEVYNKHHRDTGF